MPKRSQAIAKKASGTRSPVSLIETRVKAKGAANPAKGRQKAVAVGKSLAGNVILPYKPSSFTVKKLKSAVKRVKDKTE